MRLWWVQELLADLLRFYFAKVANIHLNAIESLLKPTKSYARAHR